MTQVLVVGAGPTGLSLACLLRQRGVDVRIVDRLASPAPLAKAMVLWSRSLEVLDELGLAHAATAEGVDLKRARYLVGDRELASVRTDRVPGTRWQPTILPQNRLESLLAHRLAELGGSVEWDSEVTAVDARADGVDVTVIAGDGAVERIRASYVVGCDGVRSAVRASAGITWEAHAPYEEVFQLGDVEATTELDRTMVHHFLGRHGVSVAIPMPGGRWRVVGYLDGEDPAEAPDAAALQRLLDECGHTQTVIGDVHWAGSFRVLRRLAGTFRTGRVLLAGDAAHVHSPAGGQGLNTGVQDAHNLAWKLALVAGERARETLLDTYDAERRPIAARILALTQLQDQRLFGARSALARRMRNGVLRVAGRSGLLERELIPDLAQMRIDYGRSPLTRGRAPSLSAYRPGRLVPDVVGAGFGRLRDVCAADAVTLIAVPGQRSGVGLTELQAAVTPLRRAVRLHVPELPLPDEAELRASGYVVGVRPDGYVGYRGPCGVTTELRAWLDALTWLPQPSSV